MQKPVLRFLHITAVLTIGAKSQTCCCPKPCYQPISGYPCGSYGPPAPNYCVQNVVVGGGTDCKEEKSTCLTSDPVILDPCSCAYDPQEAISFFTSQSTRGFEEDPSLYRQLLASLQQSQSQMAIADGNSGFLRRSSLIDPSSSSAFLAPSGLTSSLLADPFTISQLNDPGQSFYRSYVNNYDPSCAIRSNSCRPRVHCCRRSPRKLIVIDDDCNF